MPETLDALGISVWFIGILFTAIGAIWVFFQKAIWPTWKEERQKQREAQQRQRDHERQMAERKAEEQQRDLEFQRQQTEAESAAKRSDDLALWDSMVRLQSEVMKQNGLLLEFVIDLATNQFNRLSDEYRVSLKEIAENYGKGQHELRELRTAISVLVNDASMREQDRESIRKIPGYLVDILNHQGEFISKITAFIDER